MADLNAQIGLTADASGVEAGVGRAKRSIESLGQAASDVGRRGGDGLNQIGRGANDAGKEVDRVTRSMVNSIQRQIAAAEAGGTATRKYQESIARLRGGNLDVLRPYLEQLDAAKAKSLEAAQATTKLGSSFTGLGAAAGVAARAVAALGVAASLGEMVRLADASTNVASRLSLVTSSARELSIVQDRLFYVAQSSRVSFTDLVGTYAQVARSTKDLGVSQTALIGVIETISQAVTISGGSAQSAQAALVQLSQGFAAGALRGEELNSVMEQTPRLAQAIAEGLGISIGQLRAMGQAGELTAEKVIGALERAAVSVSDEFGRMTMTVEQASTQASNSVLKLVGAFDKLTGVASIVSGAISAVSGAIGFIARDLEKLGGQGPLREATAEVHALQRRATLLKNGLATGFYPPSFQRELDDVNAKLALAKTRFNEVHQQLGGAKDPRDQTGYRSRSDGAATEAERQRKLKEDANTFLLKQSGVPDSYIKDMTELIRLNREGVITGKAYTDALKKQQEILLKKTDGSGKGAAAALNDSLNAELQAYKNADKAILDERKSFFDQLALLGKLGLKGEYEVLDASLAKEDEVWAKRKANFVAEIAQAEKKKNSSTEVARITGQMQDAERDYEQNKAKLLANSALAESKYLEALEGRIDKQREVARLAGEQASAAQLEGKAIGLVGDALREQSQALLENKLKTLESKAAKADIEDLSGRLGAAYREEAENLRKLNEEQNRNKAKQIAYEYSKGIQESNRLLQAEIGFMGLSARARNIAIEQTKIRLDLEKRINDIKALEPESEARAARIAGMQASAAQAELDAANRVMLEEWKQSVQQYDDIFRQGFADMLNNGKDGWKSFNKSLVTTFKTTVADQIYKMFLQPIVINLVGNLMGLTGLGVVSQALGGTSGSSGILGMANNASSAYSLFSGGGGLGGALLGNSYVYGAAVPGLSVGSAQAGMLAAQTGEFGWAGLSATSSAGAVPGAASAAWAALPFAMAALGWFGSSYFDKGDTFSGAAYATSGGNDRMSQVVGGSLNPNVDTGDRPDREALLTWLEGKGAKRDQLNGLNDRQLHRLMILAESEVSMDRDGGPMMNWSGWAEANKDLPDFYKGPGYAFPEDLGWWEVQDQGSNERYRSMDSMFVDPRVVEASRALSEGILAPFDKLTEQLGLDADYRVSTGMAYNDKTGKIFGGLAIRSGDEELINWGKREFDNKDEYLRATFSDSLETLEGLDGLPEWAKKQSDAAQEAMAKLEGEDIGKRSAEIFTGATASISQTYAQIERLIAIIPDLAGVSQDAVHGIGQAFGSLENYASVYSGYVQNYYSEDERKSYVRKGINDSLSAYGISVDASTTRQQYRDLIEAQDLTTESGRAAYAALLKASDAFAQITPAAEAAATALEIMQERMVESADGIGSDFAGVLTQGLLGNVTGADLGGQLADAVIGGVYNALAGGFANQITTMLTDTMITPMLKAAVAGSLTSATVSQAAIDSMVENAKAAAKALNAIFNDPAFKQFMQDLDGIIKDVVDFAPSKPYYTSYQPYKQVNEYEKAVKASADTAAKAAEELRRAWTSISDSLLDEVRRIRGELADAGDQSMAYWQSQFAIDTAAARSGDEEAAKRLTDISRSLLDSAGREAASMLEMQQMRAWVAQSLQDTAGYAQAIAGGGLTASPSKPQTSFVAPVPTFNQTPIVVSADPGMLVEMRKLNDKVQAVEERLRLMSEQQREGLNIDRRREDLGQPVYMVPAP